MIKLTRAARRALLGITWHKYFATISGLSKAGRLPGCEVGTGCEILARRKVGTRGTGVRTGCKITSRREVTARCTGIRARREIAARGKVATRCALAGKAVIKTALALITKTFAGSAAKFAGTCIGKTATAFATAKAAFTRTGKTTTRAASIAATTATIARSKTGARCFGNALLGL